MSVVYKVWANNTSSRHVRAFQSALAYRKDETWQWVDNPAECHLWVIDASPELDISLLQQDVCTVSGCKVVVIDLDTSMQSIDISTSWKLFRSPMSVADIFNWLDGELQEQEANQSIEAKALVDCDIKPWQENHFKLSAWPNISRYGSISSIALTCSNLLKSYYDFDTVLTWGLSVDLLDEMLSDAYDNSLLKIRSDMDTNPQNGKHSLPDENASIVQKLMGRFS